MVRDCVYVKKDEQDQLIKDLESFEETQKDFIEKFHSYFDDKDHYVDKDYEALLIEYLNVCKNNEKYKKLFGLKRKAKCGTNCMNKKDRIAYCYFNNMDTKHRQLHCYKTVRQPLFFSKKFNRFYTNLETMEYDEFMNCGF